MNSKVKKYIKIFPSCGSTNIGPGIGGDVPGTNCYDSGFGSYQKEIITNGYALPGYPTFPEIDESKVKDFQKSLKKKIRTK